MLSTWLERTPIGRTEKKDEWTGSVVMLDACSSITDSDLKINGKTTSPNYRLLSMIYYQCLHKIATSRS